MISEFLIDGHTVTEELERLARLDNKAFTTSLHPGVEHILGVRIPDLRLLAKRIVQMDWNLYLMGADSYYMEERILRGLVLGYIHPDNDILQYLQRVTEFVHVINSWSVCDTFSFAGGKSFVGTHQDIFWNYVKNWMNASHEYEIRFGVVMSLKYFIDNAHIDELLECIDRIHHEGYYVKMAVAWLVSACFVSFPERTMEYLHSNNLDDFTYNKSLQKIVESYRVTGELKQLIKQMKRK